MTDATIAHADPVLVAIPGKKQLRRLTVLSQLDDFDRLITTLSEYDRPVRRPLKQRATITALWLIGLVLPVST